MGHANFNRIDRITALFRKELGALVHDAVREKLVPSVSVSDVEATRDLAYADVFVTAFLPEDGESAVRTLNDLAWQFRMELAKRVDLRTVPELRFKYDDSVDRGERIEGLLRGDMVLEQVALDITRKPAKPAKAAKTARRAPRRKS